MSEIICRYMNMFRAKGASDDRWYYGDLIRGTYISHPMGATTIKPETVGMCANFIDKKGKSVFEGDIVEFINDDGDASHYVIKFDGFRFETMCIGVHRTSDYIDSWWDRNVTVIGNIHDNPDLLKSRLGVDGNASVLDRMTREEFLEALAFCDRTFCPSIFFAPNNQRRNDGGR